MPDFDLLIVGGGLASARAIKSYREAGGEGSIALVSRDATLPYHRPPLSKKFLRGETDEEPLVEDEAFYPDHGVDVMLETAVSSVDVAGHAVQLDGDRLRYGKLLLATGAWPRRLPVPGAELHGVHTLRTVGDSRGIREAASNAERAVVVGAGFIGMEVSASLRQIGKQVSLVHLSRWLFEQFGVEQLSDELAALYEENGIELVLGHEVSEFHGNGGLELDNGVVVNERFETSAPDVYAAGDVANFFDPLFGRQRRIEHWSNANYQGTEVGKILAGAGGGYDTVSSFFTE